MYSCRNEDEVLKLAEEIRQGRQGRTDGAKSAINYKECELGGSALGQLGQGVGLSNDEIVSYHSPTPIQLQRINTIRAAARNFLDAISANCGSCADAAVAKRKVREAMMTANAAIVLDGME